MYVYLIFDVFLKKNSITHYLVVIVYLHKRYVGTSTTIINLR